LNRLIDKTFSQAIFGGFMFLCVMTSHSYTASQPKVSRQEYSVIILVTDYITDK